MRKTHALAALAASLLLGAEPKPEPKADPATGKEVARLVGAWKLVSVEIDGQKLPRKGRNIAGPDRARITAKTFRFIGENHGAEPYRLDPSKRPRRIDFFDPSAKKGEGDVVPGIYSLEGDTLKVCTPAEFKGGKRAPRKRPTRFDAAEGTGRMLMVFKRVKPRPEAPADARPAGKGRQKGTTE